MPDNNNSSTARYFNPPGLKYKDIGSRPSSELNKSLLGRGHSSLEKVLARANGNIDKANKFMKHDGKRPPDLYTIPDMLGHVDYHFR
jgi:hypothetical protein